MKVVVIGGAGFIGSHLVDRLLAEEHTVDVIDNLALLPRHDAAAMAQGDAFLSALATLEAARRHGVAKVVVAVPASAIYGHPTSKSLPVKEGEPSQLEPRDVRGVVARSIIDLLVSYRDLHAIEFTALALGSVYGPRQRPTGGVVAAFLDAASNARAPTVCGDGRQTRDFVFIDDVVDALVRSGSRGSGLVINIGTGEQTSITELWSKVAASIVGADTIGPTHGPGRLHEVQRFAVSPVRARIHLGWSPWTALDEGLGRVAE